MNNSPGWDSPGSAPSDPDEPVTSERPEPPESETESGARPAEPEDATPPNWSKNQPPAVPWDAPAHGMADGARPVGQAPQPPSGSGWGTPPPPPPGPGFGGGPGWASPGWQGTPGPYPYGVPVPLAAKPGVIPLRPLAVGDILEGTIATIRVHWKTVLGISFLVALLTETVSTLVTGLFFKNAAADLGALQDNPNADAGDALHSVGTIFASAGATSGISVIGQIIATAMLTIIVSRSVLGLPITAPEAWRDSRPRVLRLLGLTVMIGLIAMVVVGLGAAPGILLAAFGSPTTGAGLAVLGGAAGMVVAVWLMVRLTLATPALMLEKQGVFASMARSARLVRGSWWRIFGIQLLATVLVFVITSIVDIPFTLIGTFVGGETTQTVLANGSTPMSWPFLIIAAIGTVIGATFTFPLSAGVTALLYVDQRIRREGLDIELARAAGLPEYDNASPAPTN